jgi:hypothetical protein
LRAGAADRGSQGEIRCQEIKAEMPGDQAAVSKRKAELALRTVAELGNLKVLQLAEQAVATERGDLRSKAELTPKQQEDQRLLAKALQELGAGISAPR